jgi:TonB family protein
MKKQLIILGCLLLAITYASGKNIKQDMERKKQQQQVEQQQKERTQKEQMRIAKAQLNLDDLILFLDDKDAEFIDNFIKSKGWKRQSTDDKKVAWAFDKDQYNSTSAKGWLHLYFQPFGNSIAYWFDDNAQFAQFNRWESVFADNEYKKIKDTEVVDQGGLMTSYQNDTYAVRLTKYGKEMFYSILIWNKKHADAYFAEARRKEQAKSDEKEKSAQSEHIGTKTEESNNVLLHAETMPEFPGGEQALNKFISENLQYPEVSKESGIQGRVFAKFVVQRDGTISDIQIVRSLDPACDKEVIRIIRKMPQWKPGTQNGKSVPVYYDLPVSFKLK